MLVHSIAQQTGNLTVKHRGKIKHPSIIEKLIASGVQRVVVERTKRASVESIQALNDRKKTVSSLKPYLAVRSNANQTVTPDINGGKGKLLAKHYDAPATYAEEVEFAENLVKDLNEVFHYQRINIEKGLDIDFKKIDVILEDVMHSLQRNSNALLCVSMLRNGGEYLSNHAAHCAVLMCYFADALGLSYDDCKKLCQVGYLFDIGMTKIPKSVTHKMDPPSLEEQLTIQSHVQHSLDIVEPLHFDNQQRIAIEQHHERLDGTGYPYGLEGEQIDKYSRMLAIVDCFDAMTSHRPYQKAASPAAALKVICNPDYGYDQKLAVKFLRAIGIYPAGSAVMLNNKKLAVVIRINRDQPLKPVVRTIFSLKNMDYCAAEEFDLSETDQQISIIKPVIPEHYGINLAKLDIVN